jgi:type II secretory pathway component PulM
MKKYFAHLRPLERRLAVGVAVILILVLNWWLIWPHFSDWGNLRRREGDQAINFMRTIQSQSAASGVNINSYSRSTMHTNQFFMEQTQNINAIATDEQLVDFLYKLGSGASMVRVRDLELQPDGAKQHLNANIRLVASYQKTAPASLKSTTATTK